MNNSSQFINKGVYNTMKNNYTTKDILEGYKDNKSICYIKEILNRLNNHINDINRENKIKGPFWDPLLQRDLMLELQIALDIENKILLIYERKKSLKDTSIG